MGDRFWGDLVRLERRARSEYGYFICWHNVESHSISPQGFSSRYVPVPFWWKDWEVPQGFWSELGPAMAYVGRILIEQPNSGWWVVVCTGHVVEVIISWVWEAYDTYRLWRLPPRVRAAIDQLQGVPLRTALGADASEDLAQFLPVYDAVNWQAVDVRNNSRASLPRDFSPCSQQTGGDFVYFDPREKALISAQDAKRRRRGSIDENGRPTQRPRVEAYVPRTFAEVQKTAKTDASDQITARPSNDSRPLPSASASYVTPTPTEHVTRSVVQTSNQASPTIASKAQSDAPRDDDAVSGSPLAQQNASPKSPSFHTSSSSRGRRRVSGNETSEPESLSPGFRRRAAERRAFGEAHFALVDEEKREGVIVISSDEEPQSPPPLPSAGLSLDEPMEILPQSETEKVRSPSPLPRDNPEGSLAGTSSSSPLEYSFGEAPRNISPSKSPPKDTPAQDFPILPFAYGDLPPQPPVVEVVDPKDRNAKAVDIRGATFLSPRYGKVQYDESAQMIIRTFVESIVDVGAEGLRDDIDGLGIQLSGYLRDVRQALQRDQDIILGDPSRPVRLRSPPAGQDINPILTGHNALRGLHHFLSGIVTPPETGLALTIRGLFEQVSSYIQALLPRSCFSKPKRSKVSRSVQ